MHLRVISGSVVEAPVREQLTDLLVDCVKAGVSASFMADSPRSDIADFWATVAADVLAERRLLILALANAPDAGPGDLLGTVHLRWATEPNQPHRADVVKLLVRADARRRGVATALMREVDRVAVLHGRHLLTLDTAQGSVAEDMYRRLGWIEVGAIPGFALDPVGRPEASVLFYRELSP